MPVCHDRWAETRLRGAGPGTQPWHGAMLEKAEATSEGERHDHDQIPHRSPRGARPPRRNRRSCLIPVPGARVNAQTLDKVSYQTNWRAQAEHGGFYLAVANGIYKKHGIDCDVRMGGPQQNPSQLLLGGRVDMIMSNSFEAINYAKEDLPFLCIASIFQKDPQVLISHPGVGNDKLEDLKGKPILVGAGGRTSYWPFLRGEVRLHRRADPALHLQHGAVPGRQDDLAAGLPVVGAVRHR